MNDPRIFFAAERTLLAWVRSGIACIGVGFVVARFGLFLRLLHPEHGEQHSHPIGSFLGVCFVMLGALAMGAAAWQHIRFLKSLTKNEIPPNYSSSLSLVFSLVTAVLSAGLAAYLLWQLVQT